MEETKRGNPADEVVEMWDTVVQRDPDLDVSSAGDTIAPSEGFETFRRQKLMGELSRIEPDREHSEFDVRQTVGEGGAGLVRVARQRSLYRDVALKTVRPDRMGPGTTRELLQESWVTGMLEHPNIVPVHALGVDEHDAPMLVMKLVKGVSWAEALADDDKLPDSFRGGRDRLENHLDILVQVCNAIEFAHSKGIVHCDIKPENVMLGEFGEVYVVDWGIAVALEEDGTGRLPLATNVEEVTGTPAFIAPELAAGEGENIGPHTDVYLLGATLHEVVTGESPHEADSLRAILLEAYLSEPNEYDDDVPEGIAEICNRAMHVEPDQRFPDVEALRQALFDFERNRESRRLSNQASRRLEQLEETVSDAIAGDPDDPEDLDDEVVTRVNRLYNECRFGFEQALDVWEGNEEASRGYGRAAGTMIQFELFQRDASAAAVLMDELDDVPDELERRLEKLRRELEVEAERIERNRQLSHEVDIELASRQRSRVFILFGFIFGGIPILNQMGIDAGLMGLTFKDYFIQYATVVAGAVAVVYPLRERLFANAINARFAVSIFATIAGLFFVRITGYILGLQPPGCIALENVLLAFSVGMMAIGFDSRLWAAPIPFLAGAVGGALYPDWILYFDGASNALALWVFAFAWRETNRGEGGGYTV